MRFRNFIHDVISGASISVLCLAFGVSHADPVEYVKTRQEAERFASRLEGQLVFEGWAEDGNIEYVRRARIVPFKKVFLIQLETVFLLNVRPDANGKLNANSTCGVGHSFGLDWLDGIYLVGESGVAKNVYDGSEVTYLSAGVFREAGDCYNKLLALHADKNLSEIEISDINGQTITLSWFSNEKHDHYSDPESQFNIWEASKISVKETRISEAPVTVEVQRISKMACDDGGPPHFVKDWKYGATPWTPLEELEKGVFQDKNVMPVTFPDYDKSELNQLISKQTGWNAQYVSCNPMGLGPTYRIKRGGKTLYEIHIPVVW